MIRIYKVLARYETLRGHAYTEINYYLSRGNAYAEALKYMKTRSMLSYVDKVIIQEITISSEGSIIKNVDYIND